MYCTIYKQKNTQASSGYTRPDPQQLHSKPPVFTKGYIAASPLEWGLILISWLEKKGHYQSTATIPSSQIKQWKPAQQMFLKVNSVTETVVWRGDFASWQEQKCKPRESQESVWHPACELLKVIYKHDRSPFVTLVSMGSLPWFIHHQHFLLILKTYNTWPAQHQTQTML